jgi:hypothetical protein
MSGTFARVIGGGAHDLSWWCWVRYWLPYAVALVVAIYAACRSFGACYERPLW